MTSVNAQNTRSLWESEPATSVNAQNIRSLWESEPATSVNAQNTRSLRERVTERKSTKQTCCWITDSLSHTTYVETNKKIRRENIAEGVDNQMVLQETALPSQKFIGWEQSFDEYRTLQIAPSNICTCFGLFYIQLPKNARKPGCFWPEVTKIYH